jgi:RNA polymerase sigma factor (sigma-70 family)
MGPGSRIARLLQAQAPALSEPISDADLLARFAESRDAAAFELLVRRHGAMVLGVCRRLVRDEHLAQDAFQASFLVLARKAGGVRGPNVAGWLFRVARRAAARAKRQAEARAKRERPLTAEPAAAAPPPARELAAVLDDELARLPDRFRLPVLLCYLGGLTTEEAARALGCPRGTILSRLATARARLADRLTRRGFALPATGMAALGVATPRADALAALVPTTVRAAFAFKAPLAGSRLSTAPNSFTLAEGVLQAMTTGKLVGIAAAFLIAVGLVSGFGLTAGQTGPGPAKEPDPPGKAPAHAGKTDARAPAQPTDEAARRDAQVRALERHLEELRSELLHKEMQVRTLREEGGVDLSELERKLRLLERKYATDRELALGEVRRLADLEFNQRQKLDDRGDAKAIEGRLKAIAERLSKARTELDHIDNEYLDAETKLSQANRRRTRFTIEADSLQRSLEPVREVIHKLEIRLLELRIDGDGAAVPSAGEPDQKFEAILAELRELRREVRELKKP